MLRLTIFRLARWLLMLVLLGAPVFLAHASAFVEPEVARGHGRTSALLPPLSGKAARAEAFSASATPAPMDRFEANDTYETAATIALGEQLGKLSLPPDDVDFYRVLFTEQDTGSTHTVTVTTGYGLNVSVVVYRDTDRVAVAQTDPRKPQSVQVLQFTPDVGTYTVQIADAGSDAAVYGLYALEVASEKAGVPPPDEDVVDERGLAPRSDQWENNWNMEHAPPITMGQVLEANFVCPDLGTGCVAGDQDFYRLILKAGSCVEVRIDRQAAGVDTNVMLLDRDGRVLTGNDDRSADDMRPLLRWCASDNAPDELAVLVGPVAPLAAELTHETYALAVTLAEPTSTPTVAASLTPTLMPTGTPTVTASLTPTLMPTVPTLPTPTLPPAPLPAPRMTSAPPTPAPATPLPATVAQATASPSEPLLSPTPSTGDGKAPSTDETMPTSQAPATSGTGGQFEAPSITDAPKGLAIVIVDQTRLHVGPGSPAEVIQVLEHDEQVRLFGQAKGAWVRVQPFTSVVPGWVYAADLRPLPGTITGSPQPITGTATLSPTAIMTPTRSNVATTPTSVSSSATAQPTATLLAARVEPLDPVVELLPVPRVRLPLHLTVHVVEEADRQDTRRGQPTPLRQAESGVVGLRVQLVNVFGDVLSEGVTTDGGQLKLTRDVVAGTALYLQIPGAGIHSQLDAEAVAAGNVVLTISLDRNPTS